MRAKIIALVVLAILPMLAFVSVANAQTFRSGQSATVTASENINGSAFITGSTVDIAGKINGDLYCAGQNITISGEVNGDVICAGQTITVSGLVTGNVRMAGQTVAISGEVKGSTTLAGQTVTIESQGKINRDAVLLGQSTNVNGQIVRDLTIASSSAVINSTIGRNVTATVESATLGRNATIAGTLDYTGPNQLTKDSGAQVIGKIHYTKQEIQQQNNNGIGILGAILWALMLIVSAIIFVLLFPGQLHRTTNASATSVKQSLLTFAVGFIACTVMPVAIILLMVTVLGIPFALIILTAWMLILALSGAFAAYYVGRIIWRTQTNAVLIMLVGALVIVIALMIPLLNILIFLLAVWYGSGAILLQLQKHAVMPHYTMAKVTTRKQPVGRKGN